MLSRLDGNHAGAQRATPSKSRRQMVLTAPFLIEPGRRVGRGDGGTPAEFLRSLGRALANDFLLVGGDLTPACVVSF